MLYLSASMLLLAFSTIVGYGDVLQMLGALLLFTVGGVYALAIPYSTFRNNFNIQTIFFLIVLPMVSVVNLMVTQNTQKLGYTVILTMGMLSIYFVSIRIKFDSFLKSYIWAVLVFVVISVALNFDNLVSALRRDVTDFGQVRFSPFEIHPNLVSHIVAPSVLILWARSNILFHKLKLPRSFSIFIFFVVLVPEVATSSRGSLFSLVFAFVFYEALRIEFRNDGTPYYSRLKKQNFILFLISLFFIAILIFSLDGIKDFLIELLELESKDRGIDSGFSGRTSNWEYIIDGVNQDIYSIFFGNGFRSWDVDATGVETDSSYVNLVWEYGYFITAAIVLFVFNKVRQCVGSPSSNNRLVASILIYALMESLMARYFLAIGNPSSLLFIFCFFWKIERCAGE